MENPRIVIAAPRSGSGKTIVTCAMLKALSLRGMNVGAFKCGPDYIDPMFHKKVLGIPSKNLDLFFTDEEVTRALFLEENKYNISVIEGVMGLYDGLGGILENASTYHLAKVLKSPIILIVDAHGMGRSVLAEISGFLSMDTEHLITGVILNRITEMFYQSIKPVIEETLHIPVLGYYPMNKELHIESRYLGLKLPGEIDDFKQMVEKAAIELEKTINLDRVIELADQVKNLDCKRPEWMKICKKTKTRIGVAYDEAFYFYYEDNLKMLKNMGAELVYFSPLHDKFLPEYLDGLLLGGGYPELFAEKLYKNESMRNNVREVICKGMPSLAECGGFMYLHDAITTKEGKRCEMTGILHGECTYTEKLVRFGYITIKEKQPYFLSEKKGNEIRGHEFHYYDSTKNGESCVATKPVTERNWECVNVDDHSWWGFPHLYYPSNPEFVQKFITCCEKFQRNRK